MSRTLLVVLAVAALGIPALASSKSYYQRLDEQELARANAFLRGRGLSSITVRAFRGRLTLGGELPTGDALVRLEDELRDATGAISVHPQVR